MSLPRIETELSEQEVLERVSRMSKRGRMPGFQAGGDGGLFSVLAYGWSILDQRLVCEASGSVLRFRTVLPKRMPIVIGVLFAVTIWPGVWFTNEMLVTYWDWYLGLAGRMPWLTYAWYLPLTVIPLPWIFRTAIRRSDAAAEASGRELIERMGKELGGRVVEA